MSIGITPKIPVFLGMVPAEDPKGITLAIDFADDGGTQTIDLSQYQRLGYLSLLQSLFIDNSNNTTPVSVNFPASGMTIECPGGYQGWFPVACPNPIKMIASSPGGTSSIMVLTNMPVQGSVWATSGASTFVSDPILDGCVLNSRLRTSNFGTADNSEIIPNLIANRVISGAATNTVAAVITGTPGYYLGSVKMYLSADASIAAPGDLVVSLVDSVTGTLFRAGVTLPGVAPIVTAASKITVMEFDVPFLWNNKTNNSSLSVSLSEALVTGNLYYNLAYGTCSFVG